jgi:hypothetical protein
MKGVISVLLLSLYLTFAVAQTSAPQYVFFWHLFTFLSSFLLDTFPLRLAAVFLHPHLVFVIYLIFFTCSCNAGCCGDLLIGTFSVGIHETFAQQNGTHPHYLCLYTFALALFHAFYSLSFFFFCPTFHSLTLCCIAGYFADEGITVCFDKISESVVLYDQLLASGAIDVYVHPLVLHPLSLFSSPAEFFCATNIAAKYRSEHPHTSGRSYAIPPAHFPCTLL